MVGTCQGYNVVGSSVWGDSYPFSPVVVVNNLSSFSVSGFGGNVSTNISFNLSSVIVDSDGDGVVVSSFDDSGVSSFASCSVVNLNDSRGHLEVSYILNCSLDSVGSGVLSFVLFDGFEFVVSNLSLRSFGVGPLIEGSPPEINDEGVSDNMVRVNDSVVFYTVVSDPVFNTSDLMVSISVGYKPKGSSFDSTTWVYNNLPMSYSCDGCFVGVDNGLTANAVFGVTGFATSGLLSVPVGVNEYFESDPVKITDVFVGNDLVANITAVNPDGLSSFNASVVPLIENCSNGLDDDLDGLVDCADENCSSGCVGILCASVLASDGVSKTGDVSCSDPSNGSDEGYCPSGSCYYDNHNGVLGDDCYDPGEIVFMNNSYYSELDYYPNITSDPDVAPSVCSDLSTWCPEGFDYNEHPVPGCVQAQEKCYDNTQSTNGMCWYTQYSSDWWSDTNYCSNYDDFGKSQACCVYASFNGNDYYTYEDVKIY